MLPMNRTKQTLGLVVLLAICLGAAAAGSAVTNPRIAGWYATLNKPSWTPPNWVFGPVWTVLYVGMAVAAWLIWRQRGMVGSARTPLVLFAVQLAFNVAWSWLFFGLRSPGLAFLDIVLLWIAIAATLVAFWRRSLAAGLLLVPYLAWVTFAAILNLAIWQLNTGPSPLAEGLPGTTAVSPAGEPPEKIPLSQDEQFRRLAVGVWQDEHQGKRTLTLHEDGTGTMVVELSGLKATLVAPRLTFNMEWSVADGRLKKHSLGGEPAAQVGLILKTMGDTVNEPILELSDDRLLLLDEDGQTKYDWQRLR